MPTREDLIAQAQTIRGATQVGENTSERVGKYCEEMAESSALLGDGTSIPEAPIDGNPYVRQNAAWAVSTGGGGGVPEAPADGSQYARKDLAWDPVVIDVLEAPVDGTQYARKNASWEAVDQGPNTDTFAGLTDTPGSYAGAALYAVRVNAGETALEFFELTIPAVPPPSDATPANVSANAGTPGVSSSYSRADHVHQVSTGVAIAVGLANAAGVSTNLSRADHTHEVTGVVEGGSTALTFGAVGDGQAVVRSGTSLVGVAQLSGSSATPQAADASVGAAGVSADYSRADHSHQVSTAIAVSVGSANAAGSADTLSRSDHTHQVTSFVEGGATALSIGAVSDGQTLVRSGTSVVGSDPAVISTNAQTGTSYTLALSDLGKVVEMSNAAANTVTVPPNSTAAFAAGSTIYVLQAGAGETSIAAGAGVTIRYSVTKGLKISEQWETVMLVKRATDEWVLTGALEA
jgi:hypothetical protein